MATVTRPSTPLPDPGDEMDAEQVRDWINNLLTFLESTNIDEANVDLTSTDGILGKSTAQTITGKKTFESTNAAAAGIVEVAELGLNPASGTAADNDGGRVVLYADDDGGNATDLVNLDWVLTDASDGSEDAEFRIRALKAGTMTEFITAGSTSAGAGRVAVTGDLTVAGAITATDTTAPLILKYDAGEYVTHAVSAAGVYSIATTDDSSDSGAITLDTVDSITFDSDTASEGIVYADGGTSLLRISNSSSDVIIKPLVDAKDIIFQQYDATEVLKIDDDASVKIGGGYGSTGVTISTAGVIQANGAISSDGAVTGATLAGTISTAGVIQANGAISSDGAVTGATLAGTISTAAQNSITSASSLATVGTITSGTWSGVIDGSATMTLGSDATGDIYYRDASGFLERLASGADGTVLTGTGAGAIPAWESPTTGDITSVVAGVGLSGGGTTGDVTLTLDISELSTVTPADGDFFATLDSDGANEQKTTTTALATLFAGAGMTATNAVLNVIGGDGITANSNDVAITAAQTTVTSVYNASLKMGRDSQNLIDFATTDNKIILRVNNVDEVELVADTLQPTTSDGVALGTASLMWSDLFLASGSVVNFAAGDVTLTHSSETLTVAGGTLATGAVTSAGTVTVGANTDGHDVKFFGDATGSYMEWDESEEQLRILGPATDAAASSGKLLLATAQTDVRANDILGQIDFQAPLEAQDTDARAIAASIKAIAQDTFTASVNKTDLIFYTGSSEAATEKFRFTSDGELGVGGANYGSDGQVLTSTGAGTAPAWESVSAGVSLSGSTDNTVATVTGANALQGEANLKYTGSLLTAEGATAQAVVGHTAAITTVGGGITPSFQSHGVPSGANYYGSGMFAHWLAADNPPLLILAKSRSATIGTHGSDPATIVQDNDRLGTITWAADDGTNLESVAGAIECAIDGTPGTNDVPGRLLFKTTADSAQAPTERLRIDSTGKTTISHTGNDGLIVDGSAQSSGVITNLTIKDGDGNPVILTSQQVSSKAVMGFTVGGSQRAQINSDGNVGIGTTAPGYPLDVQGTVASMFHTKSVHGAVTGLNEVKTFASSSPADGDVPWQIDVTSKDSAGSLVNYAQIGVFSSAISNTARSSSMRFIMYNSGSTTAATLNSAGSWVDASGEAGKEYEGTRQEVWPDGILSKIKNLRVSKYHAANHPKDQPITMTHVSPTAEDFWDALGIGEDPRAEVLNKEGENINTPGIAPKNLAGVALVAVQELLERVEALEAV